MWLLWSRAMLMHPARLPLLHLSMQPSKNLTLLNGQGGMRAVQLLVL